MKKNTLIIMPFTLPWDWSADFQRQTCLELAKRDLKVIAYMSDDAHFFLKKNIQKYQKIKNISFYIPKYYIPFRKFKFIEKINKYLSLLILSFKLRWKRKIIWIFDPQFYYFPNFFQNKTSIYDCVDFFGKEQENDELKLIKNVDKIFVNSQSLLNTHKSKKNEIFLVPQGFNQNEFEKNLKLLNKKKKHKKPIIGYVGGINYRLDYKLLINLISTNPQWDFSFWGPIQNYPGENLNNILKQITNIQQFPNVQFNSTKNKLELINAINNFDICIIPYDIKQKFNLYCYPMKIFEYFYMGKPVISTPIKELELSKFNNLVKIHNSYQDWENQIKKILSKPWSTKIYSQQKKLAIDNSWKNKVDAVLDIIGEINL